tara:strand:+ start:9537 stop:10295 length:759 start_codon:yes stop_codon:yes gene_type:complete
MIRDIDFYVFNGAKKSHSCVICLAGRAGCGGRLAHHYQQATELNDTTFIGVTPWGERSVEWYPQPYSATEQREAVAGLQTARHFVEEIITSTMEQFNVPRNRIALTGFSAGAVMSLFTTTNSQEDLAGVVVHSGASLEPNRIPQCQNNTAVLLTHGQLDFCFDWYERYVPMKNALLKKGYKTLVVESPKEHHRVSYADMVFSAKFLASRLGYEGFEHSDIQCVRPLKIETAKREKIPYNWKEISDSRFKHWR